MEANILQPLQMSKDIDVLIMEALRDSDRALTTKEIQGELVRKTSVHYPRRTVNYHIEKLEKLNMLKSVLNERKHIAYIPMERYKEWTEVKFGERKIHSDQLKREVMEPWLEQLPSIS